MWRKHSWRWVIGLAVMALLSAMERAPAAEKLESELIVRTEADVKTISGLAKMFEAKYPATKVIYTASMPSSESFVKSFNEMPNPQADILTTKAFFFIKGVSDSRQQHGQVMFEAYLSPERKRQNAKLMDQEGYWQTERWAARAIVYWADAAAKHGEINCWKDLLTWKGNFEYADPIKSGAGFSAVLGMVQAFGDWEKPEGAVEFGAKLEKARKMHHPGTDTMIQLFTRKELDAHWNFDIYYYRLALQRGLKVKAVYPCEGTIIDANAVGILRNAPHPKAARAWIDFVLSREAQEWLTGETFYRTAGLDVKLKPEMEAIKIAHEDRIRYDMPWELIAKMTPKYKELWEQKVLR